MKDALQDGVSWDSLYTRESRLACQQVLYDFRGSSLYYQAYVSQTAGKFCVALLVSATSLFHQCKLRPDQITIRDHYATHVKRQVRRQALSRLTAVSAAWSRATTTSATSQPTASTSSSSTLSTE